MFRARRPPRPILKARQLLYQGRFGEAAAAFDRLARGAEERGMLARAGQLNLEAARCYLRLDDLDSAYEQARKGLRLFREAGRPGRVRELAPRILRTLQEKGRHKEAGELRKELEALIGPLPPGLRRRPMPVGEPIIVREELPEKCPHCSAPLKDEEVDWVGPHTAECPYCGGAVKLTLRRM
jgi:hypothetical protein